MSAINAKEQLQPLPNRGGWIRRLFDLQMASTYIGVAACMKRVIQEDDIDFLEVGCGSQPYMELLPSNARYTGIEWDGAEKNFKYDNEDVIHYDGEDFPVDGESQDIVFHTEVIEHVRNTAHFLKECERVLKPNGRMFFTVPFQARFHYIPYDYWRFTPSGLFFELENAGFEEIEIIERSTDVGVAAYKTLTVGYRWFFSKNALKTILSIAFAPLWITSLVIGQIDIHWRLGSKDDCLGYVVLCRKGTKNAEKQ